MFHLPLFIQQIIVIAVTIALIVSLLLDKMRPAFLFFVAVLIFLLTGIIHTADLLSAFSNESILSIFLLIFLVYGVKEHFNLISRMDRLFGKARTGKGFMLRMTSGVAVISAFLNNTPIVALFMPYIYQWAKKHRVSPSKLLIPLSYAAIMGAMMTVIGTSTNLVLNGLIESKNATTPTFLDYLLPGALVTIGGIIFLYFWGYKLLPDREEKSNTVAGKVREYLVEVRVIPGSDIVGKSIVDANLRNLSGIYLFEIIRKGHQITPVEPQIIIEEGDALVFAGDTENIMDLLERDEDFTMPVTNVKDGKPRYGNILETVIPFNSELIGRTLKELNFRENYDGAVVAIHRNGEQLRGKMGELKLKAGDLLLVSPGEYFLQKIKRSGNLYLVSVVRQTTEARPGAAKGFIVLLLASLVGLAFGVLNLFFALLLLTTYMVALKMISIKQIKELLDVDLLVILVASLTFSTALIDSGVAQILADGIIQVFKPLGIWGVVVGIYVLTLILTSFVTHVAAVSIVFPIAYGIAHQIPGLNPVAIYIAIAFAASCSFHAPFSYQTNMMIYGPGNYKFKDYLKVGSPLTLLYSVITLVFIVFYYKL